MKGDMYHCVYKTPKGIVHHDAVGVVVREEGNYLTVHTVLAKIIDHDYQHVWTISKDSIDSPSVKYIGYQDDNPEYFL